MSSTQALNLPNLLPKLREHTPVLALGIRASRTPDVVRWAHAASYDTIWIDLEHSNISLDAAAQMCATALDLGMAPWVRVPEEDFGVIGRVLDGGALGIIAPRVETVAQAQRYLTACRFAPEGQRSQISTTAQVAFARMPAAKMNSLVNAAINVEILIESAEGVANAAAIAALPGVDILGVGANDLSADLGHPGNPGHPEVLAACLQVIEAAKLHDKVAVIGGLGDPALLAQCYEAGASPYLFAGIDSDLFLAALHERIEQALLSFTLQPR